MEQGSYHCVGVPGPWIVRARTTRTVIELFGAKYKRAHDLANPRSSPSRSSTDGDIERVQGRLACDTLMFRRLYRVYRYSELASTTVRRPLCLDGTVHHRISRFVVDTSQQLAVPIEHSVSTHGSATSSSFAYCISCIVFRDLPRSRRQRLTVWTEQFSGRCRARRRKF